MLPLHRLESRRQRKPLRKISFHSLFFSSRPCALVNTLKPAEGLFLATECGHKLGRQLRSWYPQSQRYQRGLLLTGSRTNLAHRSGDALLSVYFARGIIDATFCPV